MIVFIVGCPRSGTSVFQRYLVKALGGYSGVETHYFSTTSRESLHNLRDKKRKAKDAERRLSKFFNKAYRFRPFLDILKFRSWMHSLESQYTLVVEKTPAHLRSIPYISKVFTGAEFIHVIRNPLQVARSMVEVTTAAPQHWGGVRSYDTCLKRWLADTKVHLGYLDKPRHQFVIMSDFSTAPDRYTDHFKASWNLPALASVDIDVVDTHETQWKSKVSGPLDSSTFIDKPADRELNELEQEAMALYQRIKSSVLEADIQPLEAADGVQRSLTEGASSATSQPHYQTTGS